MTALPSLTVTGTAAQILGNLIGGSALSETALYNTAVTFVSNVPADHFVLWESRLEKVPPVVARFAPDGTLLRNGDPVKLLMNDVGLNVSGIQWTCQIAGMEDFTFDADADVDLSSVAAVPSLSIIGTPFTEASIIALLANTSSPFRIALDALYESGVDGSITFAKLAAALVVTSTETIAANNNNTTLPTSAAVVGYVATAFASFIAGAPGALDTWLEVVAAIQADESGLGALTTLVGTKAPLASPTFTGTVGGITKTMVGLGNSDNTSDINKPVSTAQAAALQPIDSTLTALAALATAANKLIYATGSDVFATTDFTAYMRSLLAGTDAATARSTLLAAVAPVDAGSFPWPSGLVGLFNFQQDVNGGTTLTSRVSAQVATLTARGTKTVVLDAADPGPFGPSLVLDGATVFAKQGSLGALDLSTYGNQFTVISWTKDTAGNHDDGANGIAFRAGSHDDVTPARQFGLYFDGNGWIWSHGHLTPHLGAQDGPSPGYPFNRDYAASARKYFTGTGQGQWHMEAGTFDGSQIIAYIDGLTDSWQAAPEPPPSVLGFADGIYVPQVVDRNPFVIHKGINRSQTQKIFTIGGTCGVSPDAGQSWTTGKLGGIAVFNRALTADEIMKIRLGTLLSGEAITMFGFEYASTGQKALKRIGWTAKGGNNSDVSGLTSTGSEFGATRPVSGQKSYLGKTSNTLSAAWGSVTGLSASQIARTRFKLLSALTTSAPVRILAKVGAQWWASQSTFAATGSHASDTDWSGAESKVLSMNWGIGNWLPVTMLDTPTAQTFINLAQNPSVSVNATNWFKAGAAANATATGRTAITGGFAYRLTWTGTDTAAGAGGGLANAAIPGLTAGTMYSASMVAICSKAQLLHLEINWCDSSGTTLSISGGGCVTVAANTPTTLVATGIAPAGAVKATLKVSPPAAGGTNWVNGDTLDMTKAIVVAGIALPPAFDGDTATATWSGTAGASTSTMTAIGAGTYQNQCTNPSLSVNATNWFKSSSAANATATGRVSDGAGGFVYRLTWTGTDNGTVTLGGIVFPGPGAVVAGNSYTASMLVKPSQTAKLFLSLQWINAGGAVVSTTDGGTVTVGAGLPATLVVAGIAPATATQLTIKVTSAEAPWKSGYTFDMTNCLVVVGAIPPAYFDGDKASSAWAGTAGASASNITGVVLGTLAVSGSTNAAYIDDAPITAIGFLSSGGDGTAVRVTDLELLPS